MYDPLDLTGEALKQVTRGLHRRYYRFRGARFYGGIATGDCLGCNLRCVFCWSRRQVDHPARYGKFCSPDRVANRLAGIARSKGFRQARISGNEPTLARAHLIEVLSRVPPDLEFILETNGIPIGADPSYAADLKPFGNLHVRVCLKGTTREEFSRLTGAVPEAFDLQLAALAALAGAGVSCHAAVMVSFSPPDNLQNLVDRLQRGGLEVEIEEYAPYGGSEHRLRKHGLWPPCETM